MAEFTARDYFAAAERGKAMAGELFADPEFQRRKDAGVLRAAAEVVRRRRRKKTVVSEALARALEKSAAQVEEKKL